MKVLLVLAESSWKTEIKIFLLCAISHENKSLSQIFCELLSLETFFDSNSPHTPSNFISLTFLVTVRSFTLFKPKIKAIEWQKSPKIILTW